MILVTGGAGFIGANFVLDWCAAARRAGRQSRQAHLRRQPRQPGGAARTTRGTSSCAATSATARWSTSLLARHRPRAIVNFAAESHVDRSIHGPAAFVATNVVGTFTLLDAAKAHWSALPDGRARGVPLPARVDRRGLRLARARRPGVHRDDAVRAEQPVLGVEGRLRPPGARLPPHLRAADAHDQLLEQLRPAAVSGEADPADDRQRARRQAAAGVRRRPERARLALRRRPLRARSARCCAAGGPGETYNVGGNAEMTNLDVVHTLCRIARASCAPGRDYAAADHLREGPPGPRPPLRDRRGEDPPRARLDAARRPSSRACARTVRWYLDNGAWLAARDEQANTSKWISLNYAQPRRPSAARGTQRSGAPRR